MHMSKTLLFPQHVIWTFLLFPCKFIVEFVVLTEIWDIIFLFLLDTIYIDIADQSGMQTKLNTSYSKSKIMDLLKQYCFTAN